MKLWWPECRAAALPPLWHEWVKGKRRLLAILHLLGTIILVCL